MTGRNAALEIVLDEGMLPPYGLDREGLAATADLLFHDHSYCGEVLVVLTDDDAIRILNNRYRGIDRPTDVLSFDLAGDDGAAGEVYISLPTAERQAVSYGVDAAAEVCRLAIHGMLHLAGHDDRTEEDEAEMARETDDYLRTLGSATGRFDCPPITHAAVSSSLGNPAGLAGGIGSPSSETTAAGGRPERPVGCLEEADFQRG